MAIPMCMSVQMLGWQMTDAETLRAALEKAKISARAFSSMVVIRGVNERTMRRWLAGEWPVPPEVLKQAKRLKAKAPDG